MGKAADNERKRLIGNFYNNSAVGVALTGIWGSYLALAQAKERVMWWGFSLPPDIFKAVLIMLAASITAQILRYLANFFVSDIQD